MTDQNALAARCEQVATLARKGLNWVEDPENSDTIGPERKSLVQLLRKSARRAEKLERSVRQI